MTKLDQNWARTQVEAMADGSLSAEAERRMRALINCDPELRAQVQRARALRQELRSLANRRAPRGLARRLWQIPAAERPRGFLWAPAMAMASIAAVALTAGLLLRNPGPSPEELAREAAVQDFALVVAYLQKSALVARNEVNEAVGYGMADALATSRGAIGRPAAGRNQGADSYVD